MEEESRAVASHWLDGPWERRYLSALSLCTVIIPTSQMRKVRLSQGKGPSKVTRPVSTESGLEPLNIKPSCLCSGHPGERSGRQTGIRQGGYNLTSTDVQRNAWGLEHSGEQEAAKWISESHGIMSRVSSLPGEKGYGGQSQASVSTRVCRERLPLHVSIPVPTTQSAFSLSPRWNASS